MREMQQIQISYQYDHERLYEALKRRGMTERALAEKIYCSPATVSRIFNGCGRLSVETIITVCLALELTVEEQLEIFYFSCMGILHHLRVSMGDTARPRNGRWPAAPGAWP